MGRIIVGPPGETVEIKNVETQEMEPVVERSSVVLQSPLADNRLVILEELVYDLPDKMEDLRITTYESMNEIQDMQNELSEQIARLDSELFNLKSEIPMTRQVSVYERYDDTALRALIQQLSDILDQNYKGQEFVNSRFRQDFNSIKNEKQAVSEIIRVHERLPKWVLYGFIFNFILALLGYLT
jgi:DNA repair exonuclease SbcCD ATPase subunit